MSDDSRPDLGARDLLGLGGLLAACVVAGLVLGWFIDDLIGTSPIFLFIGLALGVASGIVGSWFRIRPYLDD